MTNRKHSWTPPSATSDTPLEQVAGGEQRTWMGKTSFEGKKIVTIYTALTPGVYTIVTVGGVHYMCN